jgi:hypothetical protein
MEDWQLTRLLETDSGVQIGGSIVRMNIDAVNGSLHTVDVAPVSVESMQDEGWDNQFVCMQVADRAAWMDLQEVSALIELLQSAREASLRNYEEVFP